MNMKVQFLEGQKWPITYVKTQNIIFLINFNFSLKQTKHSTAKGNASFE